MLNKKISHILKRCFLTVLIMSMVFGMFACSGNNANNNSSDDDDDTNQDQNGQNTPDKNDQTNPDDSNKDDQTKPEAPKTLSFSDLISTLSASPFRDNVTTKKSYGISDATVIGVDKDRFENEILYAFPADSEFLKIVNVADHGFGADNTAEKNSKAIEAALREFLKIDGNKKLVFPEGSFEIARAITVESMENLFIEGNNTVFVSTAWTHGIYINNSENIHLCGLEFTSKNTPLLTGKVSDYDPATKTVTLKIEDTHDISYAGFGSTITGYYDLIYSEEDGRYYIDAAANVRYAANDTMQKDVATNTVRIKFSSAPDVQPKKDSMVSVAVTAGTGATCTVYTTFSKNVYFENIGINSNAGMGFVSINSENIYINKLTIAPNFERKLYMSTSWDGLHTVGLRGDLVITNSIIEGTQDDNLNVCGSYDVIKAVGPKKITLQANNSAIITGDTIEIYDPATMKFCGSYTVTKVDGTVLTLNGMPEDGVDAGFLVGNVSGATHLTIDNCIFGNSYSRGGLIQTRDTKIINTTYFNTSLQTLNIHSSYDQYAEAIMPKNVLVENCKFINTNVKQYVYATVQVITHNGSGVTTAGTLKDVRINNCFFAEAGGGAVTFYGAGSSSCTNNLMYNLDRVQDNDLGFLDNCAVSVYSCSDMTVQNNYVYIKGANPNYEFIHVAGTQGLVEEKNTFKLIK